MKKNFTPCIKNMKKGTSYCALFFFFIIGIFFFFPCKLIPQAPEHYLLRSPIEEAIQSGDFSKLKPHLKQKISINLETPFEANGYLFREKFIECMNRFFSNYQSKRIEWSSRQLEEMYSVQSLNITLKNKRTEKYVNYKFIFFLSVDKEWKIYYLRGIKLI